MTHMVWSVVGGLLGAAMAFLVNLLTHRITKGSERHLAWEDRMATHVEETRYAVQQVTRDLVTCQALLTELRHDQTQDQIRLRALEDKIGIFWHTVEDHMADLLKARARAGARERP